MTTLLSLGVSLQLALAAANDANLQALQSRLEPVKTLKGRFVQSKKVALLSKPLVSEGAFILERPNGLLWRTEKPFASTLRITPQGVSELQGGKMTTVVSSQQQPGFQEVGKVFFSVFSADVGGLRGHFRFESVELKPAGSWRAVLRPADAGMAKVIAALTLEGDRLVREVSISEANGDVTEIHFKDLAPGAELAPEEARLLE